MKRLLLLVGGLLLTSCVSVPRSVHVQLDGDCGFFIPRTYKLVSDGDGIKTYYQDDPVAYIRVRAPVTQAMIRSATEGHKRHWKTAQIEKYSRLYEPVDAEQVLFASSSALIAVVGPNASTADSFLSGCLPPGN